MSWEHIGSCGNGQIPDDKDWILKCYELAIIYLKHVVSEEPKGFELGIMWHESEMGDFPSLGLFTEEHVEDMPWRYINKCEEALTIFNNSIDWASIMPSTIEDKIGKYMGEYIDEIEVEEEEDANKLARASNFNVRFIPNHCINHE